MKYGIFLLCIFCQIALFAQNQVPIVQIESVTLDQVAHKVSVKYSLSDAENEPCTVSFSASNDGGDSFQEDVSQLSGDIGPGILPGSNKTIEWEYSGINNLSNSIIRVMADDGFVIDIADLVAQVDSNRLKARLIELAQIRHYTANPAGLNKARDTIVQRMTADGLNVESMTFNWTNTIGNNITGRKHGLSNEALTYIIDAHYDSVSNSPGADDNGSGVVGMLEIMDILAPLEFKKSLRFIGFDLEEQGLIGSTKYVETQIKPYESIEGVLNFEMIGYYSEQPNSQTLPNGFSFLFPNQTAAVINNQSKGDFIAVAGNANSTGMIADMESNASTYVPDLKIISLPIPGDGSIAPDLLRSDHAPFWLSGKKGLLITDGANFRNQNYHKASDTVGTLNFQFMAKVVQATLATAAAWAQPIHASKSDFALFTLSTQDHHHEFPCTSNISPNPVVKDGILSLGNCPNTLVKISLFDTKGKRYFQEDFRTNQEISEFKIPAENLAKGIYFILLETGESTQYLRMVK